MKHPVHRRLGIGMLVVLVLGTAACGTPVDIGKLGLTDVLTGYYDAGIKDGANHLVPSANFRLKNNGTVPINEVQLTVSFWKQGDDGEWDSMEVAGIGSAPVAPGAASDAIFVPATTGYNLEQPRAELFGHSMFKDVSVRLFAKRGGRIVKLGEYPIDHRIIPHLPETSGRP